MNNCYETSQSALLTKSRWQRIVSQHLCVHAPQPEKCVAPSWSEGWFPSWWEIEFFLSDWSKHQSDLKHLWIQILVQQPFVQGRFFLFLFSFFIFLSDARKTAAVRAGLCAEGRKIAHSPGKPSGRWKDNLEISFLTNSCKWKRETQEWKQIASNKKLPR